MAACEMCSNKSNEPIQWVGWVNMAVCGECLAAVRRCTKCDTEGCNNDAAVWTWNRLAQKGLCTTCGLNYSGDAIWD